MSNSDPLAELTDEERRELVKLAGERVDGGVTRREALGVLAGGGALGLSGASLLSSSDAGQAAAQPSQSNNVQDIGSPSDRWDGWFDGLDAVSVSVEQENINEASPGTLSNANLAPLLISNANIDTDAAIVLQNRDDTVAEKPAKSGIYWMSAGTETASPRRLAYMVADAFDQAWSLYTRDAPLTDDGQHIKRLDVPSTGDTVQLKWSNVNGARWRNSNGGNVRLQALAGADAQAQLSLRTEDQFGWQLRYRDDQSGQLAVRNRDDGSTAMQIGTDNTLSFNLNPLTGLREISNPTASDLALREWAWDSTNSRWLFKDSGGTAHYFVPDGTL